MTRIAFQDTETTGLAPDDQIWEFAAIVRVEDGTEATCHVFVEHDPAKCAKLPEPFLADHRARFPADCTAPRPYPHPEVASRYDAAKVIAALFPSDVPMRDRPHIVGSNPSFDTERVALLLRRFGYEPGWYYHPHDAIDLAVGYLAGMAKVLDENSGGEPRILEQVREWRALTTPLWESEALSRAVGVDPDLFARHQALGDCEWAAAIWDAVKGHELIDKATVTVTFPEASGS
jgi:DNA polymerase III epsilon subunit-like protein